MIGVLADGRRVFVPAGSGKAAGRRQGERVMTAVPADAKVHLALSHPDRRGINGLTTPIQEHPRKDPISGHLFVFRGKNASLLNILFSEGARLYLFETHRPWEF